MTMMYELWDVESGNRIERFWSEAEALAAIRELLELNGPDLLDALALGVVPTEVGDATGPPPILEGEALLARVRAAPAPS